MTTKPKTKKFSRESLSKLSFILGRLRGMEEDAKNRRMNGVPCTTFTLEGITWFCEKIEEIIKKEV